MWKADSTMCGRSIELRGGGGGPRSRSQVSTNYLVALATSLLFSRPVSSSAQGKSWSLSLYSFYSPNYQKRYFTPWDVDFVLEFESQKH